MLAARLRQHLITSAFHVIKPPFHAIKAALYGAQLCTYSLQVRCDEILNYLSRIFDCSHNPCNLQSRTKR